MLNARAETLGVRSGRPSTEFGQNLPLAVGPTLVVVLLGDRLTLPERCWPGVTGITLESLHRRQANGGWGSFAMSGATGP